MKRMVLTDFFKKKLKNRYIWKKFQRKCFIFQNYREQHFLFFENTLFAAKCYQFHTTNPEKYILSTIIDWLTLSMTLLQCSGVMRFNNGNIFLNIFLNIKICCSKSGTRFNSELIVFGTRFKICIMISKIHSSRLI